MNYARLALAAVAATIFDACYGFAVYGTYLAPEFGRYPGVFRSNEAGQAYLPLMFGGLLVAIVIATMIYAKGYEGGNGANEGLRFGVLLGLFVALAFSGVNYAVLNIGRKLAVQMAAAGLIEWTIIGLIIGVVYKPAQTPARQSAGV
ncbi:MAG TPA: hypothetical protein VFA59_00475 [Vicinamibacterales bacterium]|nr:hypothetical protein [Vicinamibacterales bacterium]